MKSKRYHKRHFLMLEILIAFALITLCLFPLLYPHVMMLKAQYRYVNKIELDHVVNLLYADLYEKLLTNQIPWKTIEKKILIPIEASQLTKFNQGKPLPYKGSYQFDNIKDKSKKETLYSVYIKKLTFTFTPTDLPTNLNDEELKKQQLEYVYEIFIGRILDLEPLIKPPEKKEHAIT